MAPQALFNVGRAGTMPSRGPTGGFDFKQPKFLGGARELQIKAGRWVASMPCRSPITGSGLELICKRQLYIWWCHGSKGLNLEVIEHLGSIFQTKLRFPSPIHVKSIYPIAIRHGLDCGRPQ